MLCGIAFLYFSGCAYGQTSRGELCRGIAFLYFLAAHMARKVEESYATPVWHSFPLLSG